MLRFWNSKNTLHFVHLARTHDACRSSGILMVVVWFFRCSPVHDEELRVPRRVGPDAWLRRQPCHNEDRHVRRVPQGERKARQLPTATHRTMLNELRCYIWRYATRTRQATTQGRCKSAAFSFCHIATVTSVQSKVNVAAEPFIRTRRTIRSKPWLLLPASRSRCYGS